MNPLYGIILYFFLKISKNWRIIFFWTSIFNTLLAGYTWKYFLESPRYLYSIGQKIKCLSVLDKISLYNGTLTKWNEYQKINIENANRFGRASTNFTKLFNFELDRGEREQDHKGITIYDLFKFKSQIKIMSILFILCFMSSFNLNGVLFILFKNTHDYINIFILLLFLKVIIGMIVGYICDIIGRKPIIMFGGLLGSICYFIFTENNSDFFIIISLICFQAINIVLFIYIPENIPTPIRSTLSGWIFLIYKVSPLFLEFFYKCVKKEVFNYCIILSGILGGLCTLFLRETLGKNMNDIIPELKEKIESLDNYNLKSFHSTEYPSFLI
jgi:MFS family permease